ncbi:MAG: hypothetical protein PHR77_03220 [Kiritimatiellae bacterium]|nr:hypothetical protein [Kiritimatiellia bacterium]MDD5519568.1 hypothetical protein [Kiritimatiellia bacterium]
MEVNRKKMEELAMLVGEILREADTLAEKADRPAEEEHGVIRLSRRIP